MHACDASGDASELLSMTINTSLTRKDSILNTFGDATVVCALIPIRNSVKHFIDDEKEKWTPIEFEYSPDDSDWLAPKLQSPSTSSKNLIKSYSKTKLKRVKKKRKKKKIVKKQNKKHGSDSPTPSISPIGLLSPTSPSLSLTLSSLSISVSPMTDGGLFSD
eukprot:499987_1